MKMTAKQWAARAVMAAAMAAGLSACGGGGDSAAPAVAPTPEVLTAGLTLRDASGATPKEGTYSVTVVATLNNEVDDAQTRKQPAPGITTFVFFNDPLGTFGGSVSAKDDGTVVRAIIYGKNRQLQPSACGIDGIKNPCVGFKVDPVAKTFSATSVVLKAVNEDWSGLNTAAPGQVTVSGIVNQ
jgi:hypothetical protein